MNGKVGNKKYILHYPSLFGMGSNTDTMLINDEDIRYIIRKEAERKQRGKSHFCERLTGTWNDEKFCDSADMTEIEEDVIRKRLNTCSTYADVNDLIELPDDIPLLANTQTMQDTIFHIWNEYMNSFNDIIAGETVFIRHFLDLTDRGDFAGLEGGMIYDFVSFDMKRVLRNSYFMNDIDSLLKMEETRCKRFESKLNGTYKVGEEKYLDDLIEQDNEKLYRQYKMEWEEAVAKFSAPISCDDTYLEHLHTDMPNNYLSESLQYDINETMRELDYRKLAYQYPRRLSNIGIICSKKTDNTSYFRYDELFTVGCDIKYLPALKTKSHKSKDDAGSVDVYRTLINVFSEP